MAFAAPLAGLRITPYIALNPDAPGTPSPDSPQDDELVKLRAAMRRLTEENEGLKRENGELRGLVHRTPEPRPPTPRPRSAAFSPEPYIYSSVSASYLAEVPGDPPPDWDCLELIKACWRNCRNRDGHQSSSNGRPS